MKTVSVIERIVSTAWQAALGAVAAGAETVTAHATDYRTYLVFVLVTVVGAAVKNVAVKYSTEIAKVESNPVVKAVEPEVKKLAEAVVGTVSNIPVLGDVLKGVTAVVPEPTAVPVANPARTVVADVKPVETVLTFTK